MLRHAGFRFDVWKFNRQTATHGIRSLAPRRSIRYFRKRPVGDLLAAVRRMGPGLYIIGLDFHIGFLRHHGAGKIRFIHASYVTRKVMDEPAATAIPIVTSKIVVVGKVLQRNMLRAWLTKKRLKILGPR